MDTFEFLSARRRRLLGTLLGTLEETVYPKLSVNEQQALRTAVINAVNSYHEAVLDITD